MHELKKELLMILEDFDDYPEVDPDDFVDKILKVTKKVRLNLKA